MTEDDRLLLHAMLDGELDAPAQRVLEQRLQSEPDLAMAFAALRKLQGKLRALPIERSSDSLRARVETLAPRALVSTGSIARPRSVIRRRSFSASSLMAASVAALFLGATFGWIGGQGRGSDIEGALVASHVRGLIAARPFDVASSDQHTVRPWFAGKLAVAPFVADLASASFPLEGGRIDVIDGEPEPTLLYRRGPHVISVTRLPNKTLSLASLGPRHGTVAGLSTLRWRTGDQNYFAVSDVASGELDALRTAFDAASGPALRE